MAHIELQNVSIEFPVFGTKSFRKALLSRFVGGIVRQEVKKSKDTVVIRALDNINLTLSKGDRLGLIGHNGAGKTTLLKTIAGVYPPAIGDIKLQGKISPLFSMGLGLDPEETGRENIKTIGLYLGMSQKEIAMKTPGIEEFSELGAFLDMPVRTYSAGMVVRLSFSVATCVEPEILLLDEWLGAGDARFTDKAERRVNNLVKNSSIMVLASHSTDLIRNMCSRAVLLEHGCITKEGNVDEVIEVYNEMNSLPVS